MFNCLRLVIWWEGRGVNKFNIFFRKIVWPSFIKEMQNHKTIFSGKRACFVNYLRSLDIDKNLRRFFWSVVYFMNCQEKKKTPVKTDDSLRFLSEFQTHSKKFSNRLTNKSFSQFAAQCRSCFRHFIIDICMHLAEINMMSVKNAV